VLPIGSGTEPSICSEHPQSQEGAQACSPPLPAAAAAAAAVLLAAPLLCNVAGLQLHLSLVLRATLLLLLQCVYYGPKAAPQHHPHGSAGGGDQSRREGGCVGGRHCVLAGRG